MLLLIRTRPSFVYLQNTFYRVPSTHYSLGDTHNSHVLHMEFLTRTRKQYTLTTICHGLHMASVHPPRLLWPLVWKC